MKQWILITGWLGMVFTAAAQQGNPNPPVAGEIPKGPLLRRAPELAAWTITISHAQAQSGNADGSPAKTMPVEIQALFVTKSGKIYREERHYTDGSRIELWRIGAMQISEKPDTGEVVIFEPSESMLGLLDPEAYTEYSKTDFPGLDWISKRNYVGIQKVGTVDCLTFSASKEIDRGEGAKGPPVRSTIVAWIDRETRLPVCIQSGGRKVVFTFVKPPQTTLALPPKLQSFLDRRAKALELYTTAPGRPY